MRCISFFLILILVASCSQFSKVKTDFIAESEAEDYIKNKELTSFIPIELPADQDSVYRLITISPKNNQAYSEFFLRKKTSFYVFQNSNLIFNNLKDSFYPKLHLPKKFHAFYSENNKILHQIKLLTKDPIQILFKQKIQHKLEDVFKRANLDKLKREKSKDSLLPWIEVSANSSINDRFYRDAVVFGEDSILVNSKVKIRGASSKSFPKKQFTLKCKDSIRVNSIDLKKAVLYSPYIDRSLIRNKLAYDLYGTITNRPIESLFTQAVINGNYEGIYLLLPHPKSQFKKSVFSANENSFLIQIDRGPSDILHKSPHSDYIASTYIFEVPSSPDLAKKAEIDLHLSSFEEAIFANDLSVIDIQSFVDLILLNELSKNIDAYRLSTYLAFDGEKVRVPTLWDFNIAWGLAKHAQGYDATGFVINGENKTGAPLWWQSLWTNEVFQTQLKESYSNYRKEVLSNERIIKRIQDLSDTLENDLDLNFERWPVFNKNVWPNKYKSSSYSEEVSRLKEWVLNRLIWLDSQWLE